MPRASLCKSNVSENALLQAQLEASEANVQILELKQQIAVLEKVISEQMVIIKENTALLRKQRLPKRPFMNSTMKAILASKQNFKCANFDGNCPLFKLGDGTFDSGLWECDHKVPYHVSGQHTGNIWCLCSACHARRTRMQVAERNQHESESDDADDDLQ